MGRNVDPEDDADFDAFDVAPNLFEHNRSASTTAGDHGTQTTPVAPANASAAPAAQHSRAALPTEQSAQW